MPFWKRALGLVVGALCAVSAAAHGYLAEPKARNVLANSNYCPHCLAAGGPSVTYGGGRTWPNSRHGVCGDPHTGPLDHEAGGKFATKVVTARYAQGQRVTLRVKITAPHGGRFSFGLCPVPDGASDADERRVVTQKCFDANRLKNADDGTPYWWFGKKPAGEYAVDFVLPAGVSCKRCVLQWHYETGNSCTIPGTPAQHAMGAGMTPCNQSPNMEEFWNCADVSVSGDGGGEPAPTRPKAAKAAKAAKGAKRARRRERFTNLADLNDHREALVAGLYDAAFVLLLGAAVVVALPPVAALSVTGVLVAWHLVRRRRGLPAWRRLPALAAPCPPWNHQRAPAKQHAWAR